MDKNLHRNNNSNNSNRLINETSPYLLQHAYNPVNWYPWSDEAFIKAKEEDKPIFLSIGYSTCHWCHVMERESFEDNEVAQLLNDNFISIKVDREERPDVDNIYMTVCQMLTGHGGWPLSIFMTWDKKPFYAGTYFPKRRKYGVNGLMDILKYISDLWQNDREILFQTKSKVENALKNYYSNNNEYSDEIDAEVFKRAFYSLSNAYDPEYGGFSFQPKFPTPHNMLYLLRYYKAFNEDDALDMVENTLKNMFKGGIFDHVGYGFSRYSTDNKWLVPHFEKMLYDNALLIIVYAECYQITKKKFYMDVAQKTIHYVLDKLKSHEGAFYSAEDADSEGVEGKFYVWTKEEILNILGDEAGNRICNLFNVTEKGNFEGKNILNLIGNEKHELPQEVNALLEEIYKEREKRVKPFLDDKILVSWNGLLIAALSYSGRVFANKEYVNYAKKAVNFIFDKMYVNDRLYSTYRNNKLGSKAFLSDYANLIWGLIELYEASYNIEYIEKAFNLFNDAYRLFYDKKNGGFYQYGEDAETLMARPKNIMDSAMPSSNSVMTTNIIRLSKITRNDDLEEIKAKQLKVFNKVISDNPMAAIYYICGLMNVEYDGGEVVIVGDKNEETTNDFIKVININYMPFTAKIYSEGTNENYKMVNEKATAYVCKDFQCNAPVNTIEKLQKLLN